MEKSNNNNYVSQSRYIYSEWMSVNARIVETYKIQIELLNIIGGLHFFIFIFRVKHGDLS